MSVLLDFSTIANGFETTTKNGYKAKLSSWKAESHRAGDVEVRFAFTVSLPDGMDVYVPYNEKGECTMQCFKENFNGVWDLVLDTE